MVEYKTYSSNGQSIMDDSHQFPLHMHDLLRSGKASAAQAKSLLKKGWRLCRLKEGHSYCSSGGVATYDFFLFDGGRELRQLTNAAAATLAVADEVPVFDLDDTLVLLDVPFDRRSEVSGPGLPVQASFLSMLKHWAIQPSQAEHFTQWLKSPRVEISGDKEQHRVELEVPRDEVQQAKDAGAFRALKRGGIDGWFCLRAEQHRFSQWIKAKE